MESIKMKSSVKLKFRASTVPENEGVIYYQIIRNRVTRQITTNYRIFSDEWDSQAGVIIDTGRSVQRSQYLTNITERVAVDLQRLDKIVKSMKMQGKTYSVDDIVEAFHSKAQGRMVFGFMQDVIDHLRELGRDRSVEAYISTMRSFARFRRGEDLLLDDITSNLMVRYELYLKRLNITMNTISFYMRVLRAVYNRAVDEGLVEQCTPFRRVYTGIDKTQKRALPLKEIKRIMDLDLSSTPKVAFARDIFMFSFYTRGMSFVDIAYLRKSNIKGGVLSYRRRKTGQQLQIKWEGCMADIVARYASDDSDYLIPIISRDAFNDRLCYIKELSNTNRYLKRISDLLSLSTPITMYVARHSWASVAKSRSIPISVISEGMGHNSEMTTQIYLTSLDTSIIDRANRKILRLLV